VLDAYAAGVNAGLGRLAVRPFEYLVLRRQPEPWTARDSLLVVFSMYLQLNDPDARLDRQRGLVYDTLPRPLADFVYSVAPEWEAPIDGQIAAAVPLPTKEQVDLRGTLAAIAATKTTTFAERAIGSNNWALAGQRTASGAAIVANDMHLHLGVPNTWYRVRMRFAGGTRPDLCGVSLPGTPNLVAGSNGHIAWGFTNSYGDFQDLVRLEPGPANDTYLAPGGPRPFERETETLEVANGKSESLVVRKTIWGPVIGDDGEGHALALAWTAHQPGATDMSVMHLERARNLDEAAAIIGGAGMPGQNVMIADTAGRIGWVLSGRLPRRAGIDPLRPSPWSADGAGWDGWLPQAESPRLLDPPQGFAWSANARVVGGEAYARIGDGDYAPAARARQIRDRLASLPSATPADMLAIQLDDRAEFAAHWQPILEQALRRAGEAEAARLVAGWSGRAAVNDPGYRLVREFERNVSARAFEALAAPAIARWPDFRWRAPQRFTDVARRLVEARPPNLLDPRFADWDAWLADVAKNTVRDLPEQCADLASCTWGKINVAEIRHPISQAVPLLSGFLDMPAEPLPGDWSMPRVQTPDSGASERFSVSPGRETKGYLHMPGGQSGHPLSPFYRAGHADWAAGRATPFLPGATTHVLKLTPRGEL